MAPYTDAKKHSFDEMRNIVGSVAARYGVKRIYLFGSRARGDECEGSDYDFFIMPGKLRGLIGLSGLISALADIRRRYKRDKNKLMRHEYITPQVVSSPHDAFYADKENVSIYTAQGRICSEFVMCYPPGIPILAPGEIITRDIVDYVRYAKEKGCFLTGTEDPNVETVQVMIRG